MISSCVSIGTGWEPTSGIILVIYFTLLLIHGVLNVYAIKIVNIFNTVSVWWHIFGTIIIIITVVSTTKTRQPASFVFTHYANYTGWENAGYTFLLGLLMSQFTMTGYDASAHMTEETKKAEIGGPVGIVMSIVVSFVVGWAFLIGITFCIQDYDGVIGSKTGVALAQIFLDSAGNTGAILLLIIIIGAQFFCGMASVTANSRMVYAFSRDNALPYSNLWHQTSGESGIPRNAIYLCIVLSGILGLPSLGSSTAFTAVTSIATIGLSISYGIPIFFRITTSRNTFEQGPFNLGRASLVIGWVACIWITFITYSSYYQVVALLPRKI
ncbi:polyamine transporter tpo5 [Basidiobolus ranarum]|uniref:Polyamine transporter tpo5 n=1 Tax=Basidiobolus ranarum TaxID=34480 RepID=A0ABR2WMT6_9FUNG